MSTGSPEIATTIAEIRQFANTAESRELRPRLNTGTCHTAAAAKRCRRSKFERPRLARLSNWFPMIVDDSSASCVSVRPVGEAPPPRPDALSMDFENVYET